ncbi:MAG TPA: hypothetical protein VHT73_05875 [Thermodesulfobacteriota bacterium]|nr:hypothetical protein [Thermodesulfobacteriota bacterium]
MCRTVKDEETLSGDDYHKYQDDEDDEMIGDVKVQFSLGIANGDPRKC